LTFLATALNHLHVLHTHTYTHIHTYIYTWKCPRNLKICHAFIKLESQLEDISKTIHQPEWYGAPTHSPSPAWKPELAQTTPETPTREQRRYRMPSTYTYASMGAITPCCSSSSSSCRPPPPRRVSASYPSSTSCPKHPPRRPWTSSTSCPSCPSSPCAQPAPWPPP